MSRQKIYDIICIIFVILLFVFLGYMMLFYGPAGCVPDKIDLPDFGKLDKMAGSIQDYILRS